MRGPSFGIHLGGARVAALLALVVFVTLAKSQQRVLQPPGQVTPGAGTVAPAALPPGDGDPVPAKTYYEQGILIRSGEAVEPLGPDLMGDAINEYSGDVVFTHTDVSLPGNNALPVMVGRRRALGAITTYGGGLFGDWDLDVPHLRTVATQNEPNWYGGTSKTNFSRCSQFNYPPLTNVVMLATSLTYSHTAFWSGYHLYVPGVGDQPMFGRNPEYVGQGPANPIYPSDGTPATYPVVTKNHWEFSCLPSLDNGPGEGFLARSPDGSVYRFDHMVVRPWEKAKVAGRNGSTSGIGFLYRTQVLILPTLVTDRFGNWVRYTYGSTDPWRVTSISSSDGRTITLSYNGTGNRVTSIFDGTRTWTYAYDASGALLSVTRPDGSQWQFALGGVINVPFSFPDPDCDGGENGTIDFTARTGTITHPSGAVGSFTVKSTYHGRSNVPGSQNTCGQTTNPVSRYFVSRSLTSKTLSGPGMSAMTWNYEYSLSSGSFAPCNGCVNTKWVKVTDPLGNVKLNTYGTMYGLNEGLLLTSAESGPIGTPVLRNTSYGYAAPTAGPYPSRVGYVWFKADSMSVVYTPENQRTIAQQGVNFSRTVNAFDIYARSPTITRASSLGYSRSEFIGYYDHTSLWVLGQVATQTVNAVTASSTTFNATNALPTAHFKFGKLQATYTFSTDGTLYSITDGLNHATTFGAVGGYMRGMPLSIDYADGTGIRATISNIGTVTSVRNEAGTSWTYGYDTMGRLASKTPPGGDPVVYSTTNLSFTQVPTSEVGLEPNHWRQTISTGNAVTINYFDARWRKRLTTTYDATNRAGTERAQRFDYDPYNRTTFASYPARSIALITTPTPGTTTAYDALGRPIQTVSDSELGLLTTATQYSASFQKVVTDARGNATTTGYQVFDEPTEEAIAWIVAPQSLNVAISRDVFGKPLAITRSGSYGGTAVSVTRNYVYDGNQLLCKTIEPETGATVQALDAANNVAWRASGLNLLGTSSCDWASVPGASVVSHTYDPRNRVTGTGFGDGSPAIGRSYTPDGLPLTLVSNGSTWTYGYNNRRLLTGETLLYGQTFSIGRSYDANGNLAQLTYPDGAAVAYGPNALGEATQATGYASGVSYHPNGAVAAYTLSNGIVHTLSQNTRGLPLVNRDAGVMQDQYDYDANGNITTITDQQEGITSRSLGYDGLDRLTSALAPGVWGAATYAYDPLGNLRASTVGSRSSTHNFGPNNLLTSLNTNGVFTGYAYDLRGNVTGRGSQGYYFDLGNRMALANGVASYAYDGWGRRVSVNGGNGMARTHVYSNSGGQLLFSQSRQGMNTWLTRYIYLGGKLIAESDSSAGTGYAHVDALGSPVARTNTAGQLISRTRYEPYGATAAGTNPGSNGFTGIGFTGHVNDAETGLVYMQQRYYDPFAARLLSVDPIVTDGNTGGHFGRYEYAANNPYRYTDPDGRIACSISVSGCSQVIVIDHPKADGGTKPTSADAKPVVVAAGGRTRADDIGAGGRAAITDPNARDVSGRAAPVDPKAQLQAERAARGLTIQTPEKVVVDPRGNAIPLGKGESLAGSKDGRWVQVIDANGKPTGMRIDGGHNPKTHTDPRALQPHAHVPGVTNPDGTPWLPTK